MEDLLRISGLVAECRVGVLEAERATPQTIWIDLELAIDAAKAAKRDDVADAVDYAAIVQRVKALVEGKPYRLLETLAEDVAGCVLQYFATPMVLVRATKRALPGIEGATVEITRRSMSRKSGKSPRGGRS